MPTSKTVKTRNKHRGSSFEDFLKQEGLLEDVQAAAFKRALALKVNDLMKEKRVNGATGASDMAGEAARVAVEHRGLRLRYNKSALASRMRTSRAAVHIP